METLHLFSCGFANQVDSQTCFMKTDYKSLWEIRVYTNKCVVKIYSIH